MFNFMRKISNFISPMMAILLLSSPTIALAKGTSNSIDVPKINYNIGAKSSISALFDKDIFSTYSSKKAQIIERDFKEQITLKEFKVYSQADYILSIDYQVNGIWESDSNWKNLHLNKVNTKWNTYSLKKPIHTNKVRIYLIPLNDSPKGISEISFLNNKTINTTNHILEDNSVKKDKELIYSLDKSFSFTTAYHSNQITKAVLSYDVNGVSGGNSVIRAINDELAQGGLLIQTTPKSNKSMHVTEEINPQWLKAGTNKIKFIVHDKVDMLSNYKVSNVKLSLITNTNKQINEPRLVAFSPQENLSYKEYSYLRGFVYSPTSSVVKITVDSKEIENNFGAFESLIKVKGVKEVTVNAILEDGTKLIKKVQLDTTLSSFQEKNVHLSSSGKRYFNKSNNRASTTTVLARADKQTEISLHNATLNIEKEALKTSKKIKLTTLTHRDLPKLAQGMVNVTKEEVGYRFLPHGIKFDKENELKLAYDESKLPKGSSAEDIKTYFFDEDTGRWLALEKVSSASGIITSTTDHFTDMINAVIKVPDAPQAKAYGATQIKDLKIANPGAKINLIKAPKATSSGDANLNYPIEVPKGTHGMTPQVAVNYSSGASNSWMGIGWNLSTPSIGIDTRWGVPRYDGNLETETYSIAGKQLTPMAHRSTPVSRTAEKRFYPRVESDFKKIVRHGSSPKNYWWEVTLKNGTKNFYGGSPSSGFDSNAVLTDSLNGNIAHWAQVQSVDTYNNAIVYEYTKVGDAGVANGTVLGYQLYIKNINYTASNGKPGAYNINFIRDRELSEARRNDVRIDAKLGFKRVSADLLRKIEVKFQDSVVRSYEFVYAKGAFEKTLLEKIKQFDSDNELFNTHKFTYFDEVRDGSNYVAFKDASSWASEALPPNTKTYYSSVPDFPNIVAPDTTIVAPVITGPQDGIIDSIVTTNVKGLLNAVTHANEHSNLSLKIKGSDIFYENVDSSDVFIRQQVVMPETISDSLAQTARDGLLDLIYPSDSSVPLDYVRLWKAPFDGVVSIDAPVALVETAQNENADGVYISVQHGPDKLWDTEITADDFEAKVPYGVENITVTQGESILFRIHPLSNNINDVVSWSPEITYLDKPQDTYDANNLPLYTYNSMKEYIPQAEALEMPNEGTIQINGNLSKSISSDDVTFTLLKYSASQEKVKLWERSYSKSEEVQVQPDFGDIQVNVGDKILGLFSTKSNVDFKSVTWDPIVTYKTYKESFVDRVILGDSGAESFEGKIKPYYTIHQAIKNSFGWQATSDATLNITANVPAIFVGSTIVNFTVKSDANLLAQQAIEIIDGEVIYPEAISVDVRNGDRVYFEYHYTGDPKVVDTISWMPNVTIDGQYVDIETLGIYNLPSSDSDVLYRGWGAFTYDAIGTNPENPVKLAELQGITSDTVVDADAKDTIPFEQNATNEEQDVVDEIIDEPIESVTEAVSNDYSSQADVVGDAMYTAPTEVQQSSVSVSLPSEVSAISGSSSTSKSVYASATFGWFDAKLYSKSRSVGGRKGGSESESDGILSLVDIDGDSLPDQVIKYSGGLGYRKNLSNSGIESFAPLKHISGVNSFQHSKSTSSNKGFELHIGVFAGINNSSGKSTTDIYFSDVNGDGLIDIVSKGVVYYNELDKFGTPTFSKTSENTPNPINETVSISGDGWIEPQTPEELAQLEQDNPLHDTVRVWIAPQTGKISITAPVNLIENNTPQRSEYTTADGVRVAIQHEGSELWRTTIEATDYSSKTPQGISDISVNKGDSIYFRVHSISDGSYDNVYWAPSISYTDKNQTFDANNLPHYSFDSSSDFLISGFGVNMPIDGTISITSTFSKPDTSDDVILRIVKIDDEGNFLATVMEKNIGQGAITKNINLKYNVVDEDIYKFEIFSDSNIDWTKISWKPTILYTHTNDSSIVLFDANNNPYYSIKVPVTIQPYSNELIRSEPWIYDDNVTALITPKLSFQNPFNDSVVFSIKKDQQLVVKGTIEYRDGELTKPIESYSVEINQGDEYYLEYHTNNMELASHVLDDNTSIEIVIEIEQEDSNTTIIIAAQAGVYTYSQPSLLGSLYRNWGHFVYNANDARALQAIDESKLTFYTPVADTYDPSTSDYDPSTSIFVPMASNGDIDGYSGMDLETYVNATTISASRYGEKYLIENSSLSSTSSTNIIRGIKKITKTTNNAYTIAVGAYSEQDISVLTDFKDMNGDKYPDIIGRNQLQYTTMLGSLEESAQVTTLNIPTSSSSDSTSISLGGTYPRGEDSVDPVPSLSGNFSDNSDSTTYTLRDINGDGLPDRLRDSGMVSLNLGYSFAAEENWGFNNIQEGSATSSGGGLGVNIDNLSISFGLSINTSNSKHTHTLMDMNSDGLADEVFTSLDGIKVRLNMGGGFSAPILWNGIDNLYGSKTKSESINGTITYCYPIPVAFVPVFKVCANGGGSTSESNSYDKSNLTDINGDGQLDYLSSSSATNLSVKYSTIGKTNLLKIVQRPLGGTITLDYAKSGNTYKNPHSKWLLSEVETFDGHSGDGSDTSKKKFAYHDGYYDRYERDAYGFEWVETTDLDTVNDDAVYRKNIQHYINTNYYEKGLLDYTKVTDGKNNIYVEMFNKYSTINIFTKEILDAAQKQENSQNTFAQLSQTQSLFYEGQGNFGQQIVQKYIYDNFGNVIKQEDLGETSDASDDYKATVTYHEDLDNYILSVPKTINIHDNSGKLLRHREATVNVQGSVTQVQIDTGSSKLTTDISYDNYGNIIKITYPQNHNGQRYALDYTIDNVVNSYTTQMRDSFGYTANAKYDYRFGAQTSQSDINNQDILTTFDAKGRIASITGPLEVGTGIATISHSYYPDADTPYAITQHFDEDRADTLDTVTFIDGLMRVIQTKKDAAIDEDKDGVATDGMSVSGHIEFDSFGRSIATYYPTSEGLGSKGAFNTGIDSIAPTKTSYDIQDRKLITTLPDASKLTNLYGFKGDRAGINRFHTLSTDANSNISESFKDVRKRITSVLQHNPTSGQGDIWSSYYYNAVNELIQVKDDKLNVTQAIYDMAGRRTHLNNPDTGWVESIYDNAGNVVSKITPNLKSENKAIEYNYDYNRLSSVSYPNNPSHNVSYSYGNQANFYNAGRITQIVDASGERLFEYGKLGETTKETRTLVSLRSAELNTYVTEYRYDTWNRLKELTYPDGEVLTHNYDSGGKLSSLQGNKGDFSYDYLKALTYDKFGQRVYAKYANDTESTYSYEEQRRRLSNLITKNTTHTFMSNSYSYDAMQNIIGISNSASVDIDSSEFGGEATQDFSYDNLYQLTGAKGSFNNRQGHLHRYNLEMSYDSIGNIKSKDQKHERFTDDDDEWKTYKTTSYKWDYEHKATQPHAPTNIGNRTFTYDRNGNQTGWTNNKNASHRVIVWDEDNRISSISDNGQTSEYVYDASGDRTQKNSAQGETHYVNAYYVIREGTVASKHFFSGSQRIATKLAKQESQTQPKEYIYENEQYYYHPDHLGSSSFITDETGKVYEHLEYFPFGETWIHEHSNTQKTPYRFTGKEYDEVTGLYYYGARYYDPRTSVWQSPDPILDEYMSGKENSGVFNPKNLALYSYTFNNPIIFVDPDGKKADFYVTARADKGFNFVLYDDKGSDPVEGTFNKNTTNFNQLKPGDYSVKPRPKVSKPGFLGKIADFFRGTTDRNKNAGNPTMSNTDDWNTIKDSDGEQTTGAQIHEGRDGTDEGTSLGCMVTDKETFDKIQGVVKENYDEGVSMHIEETSKNKENQ